MATEEFDQFMNAPDKDDGELDIETSQEVVYRQLKRGETPVFAEQKATHQTTHGLKEKTIRVIFVTVDGTLIRSPKDIKGICHACRSVLTRKRRCSKANCDRLLCTLCGHPHPEIQDTYFCEEHWKEFSEERRAEELGAVLFDTFKILVGVFWVVVSLVPLVIPVCLLCWSWRPLAWWWNRYPWR
jgi:hypothetical protein